MRLDFTVVHPVALLVIAKAPLPGRVKTRLTPPLSPAQAASLAAAALADTIEIVSRTPASRRVLVFDGDAEPWRPDGFEVIAQRGGELGERLQGAFDAVSGPALLIGMDTPHLTPDALAAAAAALQRSGVDAVLGPAEDGGYWGVGMSRRVGRAFTGVPMSAPDTCARQRERFAELGLRVREQPALRDVDTIEDARAAAAAAPHTRFAHALASVS
jgi:rSAM/selenodomain-associated transferase 1